MLTVFVTLITVFVTGIMNSYYKLWLCAETSEIKCQQKKTWIVEKTCPPSWQCFSTHVSTDSNSLGQTNTIVLYYSTYLTQLQYTFSSIASWNPLWNNSDFRWLKTNEKLQRDLSFILNEASGLLWKWQWFREQLSIEEIALKQEMVYCVAVCSKIH